MSERVFSKVSPNVWRSPRFRGLGEPAQIGFFYLLTNPHVSSAGIYELPDGYACADLGWSVDTYRSIRQELIEAEMIDYDEATDSILIERWFKHNPPTNDDHAAGACRRLLLIECDRLREKALVSFDEASKGRR